MMIIRLPKRHSNPDICPTKLNFSFSTNAPKIEVTKTLRIPRGTTTVMGMRANATKLATSPRRNKT